jgi:putative lipoic acid-binding regulatory protein
MDPPRLAFPCAYPIKVMMRAEAQVRAAVDRVVERHSEPGVAGAARERASGQGNFVGVTYTIEARDPGHIAALFTDIKDIEGVLMVL